MLLLQAAARRSVPLAAACFSVLYPSLLNNCIAGWQRRRVFPGCAAIPFLTVWESLLYYFINPVFLFFYLYQIN